MPSQLVSCTLEALWHRKHDALKRRCTLNIHFHSTPTEPSSLYAYQCQLRQLLYDWLQPWIPKLLSCLQSIAMWGSFSCWYCFVSRRISGHDQKHRNLDSMYHDNDNICTRERKVIGMVCRPTCYRLQKSHLLPIWQVVLPRVYRWSILCNFLHSPNHPTLRYWYSLVCSHVLSSTMQ